MKVAILWPTTRYMERRSRRYWLSGLILTSILCLVWSDDRQHLGDDELRLLSSSRRLLRQHYLRGTSTESPLSMNNSTSTSTMQTGDFSSASSGTYDPLLPNATATLPLHATSGTHHVYVFVGSPPQRQTLIVDTGSRLMAFPCQPCLSCGKHASSYFDPDKSTTDRISTCGSCRLEGRCSEFNTNCLLTQKYTEGSSWHAYEMEDVVWFGTHSVVDSVSDGWMQLAVPYVFGCQTSETGLFRKQYADGILGVALHHHNIVEVLYQAGAIARNAFSLCFTRTGGQLALGGTVSHKRHLESMRFVPLDKDDGFYSLKVVQVHVGDICITCGQYRSSLLSFGRGKGTILDSGTTDTYLPKAVAIAFAQAWETITGLSHAAGRTSFYTFREFAKLPSIVITFEGNTTLIMLPEMYMEGVLVDKEQGTSLQEWGGSRKLTNRIYVDEPMGAVLGANAMMGYDVFFDVQERRVGLARADCQYQDDDGGRAAAS